MAVYEFQKHNDFIEGIDNEHLKEISNLQKKLDEYYKEREKVGQGVTFGDKQERQENLEIYGDITLEKIQETQKEIDKSLNDLGVSINPSTGEIDISSNNNSVASSDLSSTVSKIEEDFESSKDEYRNITNVLYGVEVNDVQQVEQAKDNEEGQAPEITSSKGLVQTNNEVRQNLIKRDVEAKRIIEARAKLEAIKDNMDMDAALHVAKKNRLMLMIEQIKLEILRLASSGNLDKPSLEAYESQISSLMDQISHLENDFVAIREQHMGDFFGARDELENSQKEIEIERKKVPNKGSYQRSLQYSDEGILSGDKTSVRKNDRTANEEEIFDERGVMVYGVADILSRTKSINVEGTVVECQTDFVGCNGDFEDSFKIGNVEKLTASSIPGTESIEEKPDIDEIKDNVEANEPEGINLYESMVKEMMFRANDVPFELAEVSGMSPEQRRAIEIALRTIALDSASRSITPDSLALMYCIDIARESLVELSELEQNMGEIMPPPSFRP